MKQDQLDIYIEELCKRVYLDCDREASLNIYNDIVDNYDIDEIKLDLYKLLPIMSYFIIIRDMSNLKKYIDILESNSKSYSKYELYFIYYFQAAYFHYNDYNAEGTLYSLNLIDLDKFRRYVDFKYIHYICGLIESLRGAAYFHNKEFDKAEEYFNKSIEYYQTSKSLGFKLVLLGNLATAHLSKGNLEEASKIYYQILEESKKPPYNIFINNLALIEILQGNILKAKFLYDSISDDLSNKDALDSKFASNTYKHVGALLYYYLDDIKKSKEYLNNVNIEVSNDLNAGYFNKLITAFIYRDYSNETVLLIKDKIFPYFKRKNNTGNMKLCDLYFEEIEKYKISY